MRLLFWPHSPTAVLRISEFDFPITFHRSTFHFGFTPALADGANLWATTTTILGAAAPGFRQELRRGEYNEVSNVRETALRGTDAYGNPSGRRAHRVISHTDLVRT